MNQTLNFKLFTLNFRRELRIALLAAMETCWVFAVILLLAQMIGTPHPLTPLPFFLAYWLAMLVGRVLPQTDARLMAISAAAIAFIIVFAVARVELYPNLAWSDFSWLARFVSVMLSLSRGFMMEHVVAVSALYLFIRGLGLAQRPLTLWFVGLQFRIGIVFFFLTFLVAAFARAINRSPQPIYDPSLWVFVYFFVSLFAIALARIEEMAGDLRYTPRWAMMLFGSVGLVLLLGLVVLQIFTVEAVRGILGLFVPIWLILGGLLVLLTIPFAYIAEWLVNFLRPLVADLDHLLDNLLRLAETTQEQTEEILQSPLAFSLMTIVQPLIILALVMFVLYLVGRALNRRMQRIEAEQYIRESIGDQAPAQAQRASLSKRKKVRARSSTVAAETIRRIYAALIARAGDAGLTRRIAETPYEYEPRLEQQWTDQADDIRAITEAYVEVHYAEQDATRERLGSVKDAWERIQKNVMRKT